MAEEEDVPPRRARPCYGAAVPVRAWPVPAQSTSRASRAKRPQGRAARSLKKRSSVVVTPLSSMCSPGTPPARSCCRFAATRSTSQWPGPSGRATPASSAAGPTAPASAVRDLVGHLIPLAAPPPGRRTPAPARPAPRARPWRRAPRRPPRGRAAPSGMHGGEDAGCRVDQRERHAVGHQDDERHAGSTSVTRTSASATASSSAAACPARLSAPRPCAAAPRAPAGRTPTLRARRRTRAAALARFATTASASSPTCSPRLSVSYGGSRHAAVAASSPRRQRPTSRRRPRARARDVGQSGTGPTISSGRRCPADRPGGRPFAQDASLSSHMVVGTTDEQRLPASRARTCGRLQIGEAVQLGHVGGRLGRRPRRLRARAGSSTPRTSASDRPASRAERG